MEKIRELALKSAVYEAVKRSLKIEKRQIADFLIHFARNNSTFEGFQENLKQKKVTISIDLSKFVFDVVKKHDAQKFSEDSIVLPIHQEQEKEEKNPEIGVIYRGRVTTVSGQGAFLKIEGFHGKTGFLPLNEMKNDPASSLTPSDIVGVGQSLYVKVIKSVTNYTTLSIRGIDQSTGLSIEDEPIFDATTQHGIMRSSKRLTSPERFEMLQLMRTGAIDQKDVFNWTGEYTLRYQNTRAEEYFEIALNKTIPPFLVGLQKERKNIVPMTVQSNPEGSLARAAREAVRQSHERFSFRRISQYSSSTLGGLLDDEMPSVVPSVPLAELPEWKRQTFGSFGPSKTQTKKLPITEYEKKILDKLKENRVFILVGETGCGKTTQIPQMLYKSGIAGDKLIAVTQPRRVAAISVAERVAEEMGEEIGGVVGYQVRFEECVSPKTKIKFMTDGMLLKECLTNKKLPAYGVIMLDEAHERTVHTDVLFGLMRELLETDTDIKVIVTSATLQKQKFSNFFFNCPVLEVPGRTFPVITSFAVQPFDNYLEASIRAVLKLHQTEEKPGDILLFLTGQEDIDAACEALYQQGKKMERECGKLIVLPIYSSLPSEQQSIIFMPTPPGERKVVVATNIAETSITIDGIRYVVDPGLVKEMRYDPRTGMDTLEVVPISRASADQRKGRAGRTQEGKCIRLYTEEAYLKEMQETSVPEIQRANMAMVALDMKVIGIDDLVSFNFMDKPPTRIIIDALDQLYVLGALDEEGNLTKLGKDMSNFSLNPQLAKVLIMSAKLGCSEEALIIVAILSVQTIWYRPKDREAQADAMKAKLNRDEGDHLTLLHVYREWEANDFSEQWCKKYFVQYRSLRRAQDVINQLRGQMERFGLPIESCKGDPQPILKAIVSGFFAKAARKTNNSEYKTIVDDHPVYMFPGSSLFGLEPEYVIFHELVNTTREYMRNTVGVDPRWLVELAPAFYRKAEPGEITARKHRERLQPLATNRKEDTERSWRITEKRIISYS